MRKRLLTPLVLFAVVAAFAPAAHAAPLPRSFFGVVVDGPGLDTDGGLGREAKRIRRSGTGSVRVAVRWFQLEPEDGRVRLDGLDALILDAARQRLRVLPTIHTTPGWAAKNGLGGEGAVPRDPSTYARFVGELVERYGARGSLWREHPEVPKVPVREWEVWNEPAIRGFWDEPNWSDGYAKLLRASYPVIKRADPKAVVVAAGQANASWQLTDDLYREGVQRYFDAVAVHPYTANVDRILQILTLVRRTMRQYGDSRKPLLITEMGFSSGQGKAKQTFGWETTEAGQARMIRTLLPALGQQRKRQRISSVYWYTWITDDQRATVSFDFSGLYRLGAGGRIVPKPAAAAWRQSIRSLTRRAR